MSAAHTDLTVELRLGSSFADLPAEGVNVAIRIGHLGDSGLTARKIGASRRVLVATPELAARVDAPEDLETVEVLSYRPGRAETRVVFDLHGTKYDARMPCRYGVNSMTAVRAMVLAGHGAHLGPERAYSEDLATGRLAHLSPDATFAAFPIHAVWPPTPFQPAAPRAFISAMAEALRAAMMA